MKNIYLQSKQLTASSVNVFLHVWERSTTGTRTVAITGTACGLFCLGALVLSIVFLNISDHRAFSNCWPLYFQLIRWHSNFYNGHFNIAFLMGFFSPSGIGEKESESKDWIQKCRLIGMLLWYTRSSKKRKISRFKLLKLIVVN